MKHMKRIVSILLASILLIFGSSTFVSAKKSGETYQQGIVLVTYEVEYQSSNFALNPITASGYGTGFAVGNPGEKVQYIATCDHVVRKPAGVYSVYYEYDTGDFVTVVEEAEGTMYPDRALVEVEGDMYIRITDYFTTTTTELNAVFSLASGDAVSLTIAQYDHDVDLAVCKLASDPTDKISAMPIQLKDTVKVNTDIVSVGYASTSSAANDEGRYDKSDSTLKDGIISKIQRSTGLNNSGTAFDIYEVTADITTGMSGGPVISEESGAIVGVNSFMYNDFSQLKSAEYAICADYLVNLLDKEKVPYKIVNGKSDGNLLLILIIGGAVLILAIAAILLIVLLKKKNSAQVAGQGIEYANNIPYAGGNAFNAPPASPAPEKKYYLICVSGPLAGKKFGVTNIAVIGRDSSKCNVVFPINHPGVSGVHCEVRVAGGVMSVKDCGSSYGTFLADGTKLAQNTPSMLPNGSRFWIGSKDNMFEVKY